MTFISFEQQEKDPDWWDHLRPGDIFRMREPGKCGICGCESDFWELVSWMGGRKLHLICPGRRIDSILHDRIDRKMTLLYRDELPSSVIEELKREIEEMKSRLHAVAAARMT